MRNLVFDGDSTAGLYLVRSDDDAIFAGIARHWTRTSFVVSTANGTVLCKVDRGGLIFITWVAVTADDQPLLTFRSKVNGGKISFADGRSARLKRAFLSGSGRWSILDEDDAVLATGCRDGSRWRLVWRGLAVRVDDERLTVSEVVAVVESYRLDHARRKRSAGVITDAVRRV